MYFFVCDQCNHIDAIELVKQPEDPTKEWRCSKCLSGIWHNRFPYETYNKVKDLLVVNRPTSIGFG